MAVNGWNFLVQIYYIPTYYQLVYGYSVLKSGLLLLPITLTQSMETQNCSNTVLTSGSCK